MQIVKNSSQSHCNKCNCAAEKSIASITYKEFDPYRNEYYIAKDSTKCGYCKTCNTIWSLEQYYDLLDIEELVLIDIDESVLFEIDVEFIGKYWEWNGGDESCKDYIQAILIYDGNYPLKRHNELKANGYLPIGYCYGNKGADDTIVYAKLSYLEELIANYKDWQNKNNV